LVSENFPATIALSLGKQNSLAVVKKTLLTTSLMIMGLAVFAQTPKFTVSVSSDTVLLGNYFELKYTIENASASGFEAPDLYQFNIVSGPNTSSSFSIVNGEMSQSASYSYYLQPAEIGVYTIKPAYLTSQDVALEAPPIDIIVVPNPEGIIQRPHTAARRIESYGNPKPVEEEKPSRPRKKF
jgi:hypothetical protein